VRQVTVGSIRWRILKETIPPGHLRISEIGYSGFDPMEDTERVQARDQGGEID